MSMREELSTPNAYLYRWVIPALLTVAALHSLWHFSIAGDPGMESIVTGTALAAVMVFVARLFDRAKRVWLEGNTLHICDYTHRIDVELANVERIRQTAWFHPDRVTIHFRKPTVFGSKVVFFPRYRWLPLPLRHPVVARLENLLAGMQPPPRSS